MDQNSHIDHAADNKDKNNELMHADQCYNGIKLKLTNDECSILIMHADGWPLCSRDHRPVSHDAFLC